MIGFASASPDRRWVKLMSDVPGQLTPGPFRGARPNASPFCSVLSSVASAVSFAGDLCVGIAYPSVGVASLELHPRLGT